MLGQRDILEVRALQTLTRLSDPEALKERTAPRQPVLGAISDRRGLLKEPLVDPATLLAAITQGATGPKSGHE